MQQEYKTAMMETIIASVSRTRRSHSREELTTHLGNGLGSSEETRTWTTSSCNAGILLLTYDSFINNVKRIISFVSGFAITTNRWPHFIADWRDLTVKLKSSKRRGSVCFLPLPGRQVEGKKDQHYIMLWWKFWAYGPFSLGFTWPLEEVRTQTKQSLCQNGKPGLHEPLATPYCWRPRLYPFARRLKHPMTFLIVEDRDYRAENLPIARRLKHLMTFQLKATYLLQASTDSANKFNKNIVLGAGRYQYWRQETWVDAHVMLQASCLVVRNSVNPPKKLAADSEDFLRYVYEAEVSTDIDDDV